MDIFANRSIFPLFAHSMNYDFLKKPFWWNKFQILNGIVKHQGYLLKIVNVIYLEEDAVWQQERDFCVTDDNLDRFLSELMDLSMTHMIIGVSEESVFVSKSLDHQTNIDGDVVDAFVHLFNRPYRYMVNVSKLEKLKKRFALQNKPNVV